MVLGAESIVPAAVMQVGIVNMRAPHRFMSMTMRMRFRYRSFVRVLMMVVVDVNVLMIERVMPMVMFVPLGQMQPKANAHESCSRQ